MLQPQALCFNGKFLIFFQLQVNFSKMFHHCLNLLLFEVIWHQVQHHIKFYFHWIMKSANTCRHVTSWHHSLNMMQFYNLGVHNVIRRILIISVSVKTTCEDYVTVLQTVIIQWQIKWFIHRTKLPVSSPRWTGIPLNDVDVIKIHTIPWANLCLYNSGFLGIPLHQNKVL